MDREDVIKALECCIVGDGHSPKCELCPYATVGDYTCQTMDGLFTDAIALLKAQEPVAPVRKSFLVSAPDEYGTTPYMTVCGACGAWLLTVEPRAKYCPNCGRAVKWE